MLKSSVLLTRYGTIEVFPLSYVVTMIEWIIFCDWRTKLSFHIIADSEKVYKRVVNITSNWPIHFKNKIEFKMYDVWYPKVRFSWYYVIFWNILKIKCDLNFRSGKTWLRCSEFVLQKDSSYQIYFRVMNINKFNY